MHWHPRLSSFQIRKCDARHAVHRKRIQDIDYTLMTGQWIDPYRNPQILFLVPRRHRPCRRDP